VTITDEMDADLQAEATKRGASVAGLVRLYVSEGLVRDLKSDPAKYVVKVGGDRRPEDSD